MGYHVSAFKFHSGLSSPHTYSSQACGGWFWVADLGTTMSRQKLGSSGCTVKSCSEAILNIGNPAIWWALFRRLLWRFWFWC